MTIQSIDQATGIILSHSELKQACDELREAHFEMGICAKNLTVANKFMDDSRNRLTEAVNRMERILKGLRSDA